MDTKNQDIIESAEDLEIEKNAQIEVKEDEIKAKIAEELGINAEDEPELIEKLVKRELSHRQQLNGAIKQKISWRDKAKNTKPEDTPKDGKDQKEKIDLSNIDELVDKKLNERLEERELKDLHLPEELETEVKDLAKVKGISIKEAAQLPYIVSRKEAIEKEERIKNAIPSSKNKGSYQTSIDPSKPLNPANYALDTEEGRKAWKADKAARERYEMSKNS